MLYDHDAKGKDVTLEKAANEDGKILLPALLAAGLILEVWSGNIDLSSIWAIVIMFGIVIAADIWRYKSAEGGTQEYAKIGVLTGYHLVMAITLWFILPVTSP